MLDKIETMLEFHSIYQRWNDVVNMTIFKNVEKTKKKKKNELQRWLIWLTTIAFDCDKLKRKANMQRTI